MLFSPHTQWLSAGLVKSDPCASRNHDVFGGFNKVWELTQTWGILKFKSNRWEMAESSHLSKYEILLYVQTHLHRMCQTQEWELDTHFFNNLF